MTKRTLSQDEKTAAEQIARQKWPGEAIVVQDDTDDDGNIRVGRIREEVLPMPKGWKKGDPFPSK